MEFYSVIKKTKTIDTHYNMGESQNNFAKWIKLY